MLVKLTHGPLVTRIRVSVSDKATLKKLGTNKPAMRMGHLRCASMNTYLWILHC